MRKALLSLRTRVLAAMLTAILVTDLLSVWIVNDRIASGAQREADAQARSHLAKTQALYAQRAATLAAEGEAVSFYPAVITALTQGQAAPLLTWSSQVAAVQSSSVTVVDLNGRVLARGHAPELQGDEIASRLEGVRLALDGTQVNGAEDGDELGLALRGYAPVRQGERVVGAIMIAERLDDRLLNSLANPQGETVVAYRVMPPTVGTTIACVAVATSATCQFDLTSPTGRPTAALSLQVSLMEVERARRETQQALWITGLVVAAAGGVVSWLLARSLTAPLLRLTTAANRIAGGNYDDDSLGDPAPNEIGVLGQAFDTMRQRVGKATADLRDERDVLDAVLQSAGDGILLLDSKGLVVVANQRWTDLVGSNGLRETVALTRIGTYEPGVTLASAVTTWLRDPERIALEDYERNPTATVVFQRFRCYSAPVRSHDGALIGRILVLRDVTRESEAERIRAAFVSNVSHELRSPLTSIKGYVDTLLQGGPWESAEEREFLEIISASADKLASLIDNLLDAAKMEAGVLRIEREPVRVERIARRVVTHHQHLTPSHHLGVDAPDGLPIVNADPLRVEQILTNLVENAIKYSPDGGAITIQLREHAGALTVSVSDRGAGIAPEQAERLFERFYRVDGALTRSTKGLGLGLFISRSLVEAHGGRIGVESAGAGQGSRFWFTLPLMVDTAADRKSVLTVSSGSWEVGP